MNLPINKWWENNKINLSAREIWYNFNCWTRSRQGYINTLSNWIFMIHDFGLSYSWGNQLPCCTRQGKKNQEKQRLFGEKLWFKNSKVLAPIKWEPGRKTSEEESTEGKINVDHTIDLKEKTLLDRFTYSILLLQTTHSRFSPMCLPNQRQCSTLTVKVI